MRWFAGDAEFPENLTVSLKSFHQIEPRAPVGSFQGQLRPYQEEAWLAARTPKYQDWGILADDIGLGKTGPGFGLARSRAGGATVSPGSALTVD